MKYDPDEIDISDFLSPDGKTLDVAAMQKYVKKELLEAHQKTERWQAKAIQLSVPAN